MTPSRQSAGTWLTLLALLLCLGPPLAVGLSGLGLPWWLALAIPPVVALAIGFSRRAVPAIDLDAARRHPVASLLCATLVLAASISMVRASIYAYDVGRPEYSVAPGDAFRVRHCCLTGYAEAARYLSANQPVYDRESYRPGRERRLIGPLTVDYFHYPPPFLLLASAVRLVAPDFFDTRRVWFGFQAVVLGATMLLVAWWVGSREGRRLAWLAAGAFALSTLALQSGNYQTTALALSLAGCILASGARASAGTAMLGFAVLSKIFPGILALHVVAWRRPRVTLALVAWGAAIILLTAMLLGLPPFVEFVRDELPRLASGASFPQTELPGAAQANQSIYGLTTKLRHLGLTLLDRSVGRGISSVYTLLLVVVALATGWRAGRHSAETPRERLWMAAIWLTILNCASYLSPFVGSLYGAFGTIWLLTLLAALAQTPGGRALVAVTFLLIVVPMLLVPGPDMLAPPDPGVLRLALVGQVAVLATNAFTLAAWWRRHPA